jgi:hypothetical protein
MLDQLYFEHLSYFSISSVNYAIQMCEILEFGWLLDPFSIYGPSVTYEDYHFAKNGMKLDEKWDRSNFGVLFFFVPFS